MPNTVVQHFSGYTKNLLGVEGEQHIIDLVEKSVFKDARLLIKFFDNRADKQFDKYNRPVVFFIHSQRGTIRYRNRSVAYPCAFYKLFVEIETYLNSLYCREGCL